MQKTLTFLAPLFVVASLALPVAAQDEVKADTVVATVNGTDITLGHMIIARATLPEQYQQLPPEVLFKGILDQLVQQTALAQSFEGQLPARVTMSIENERRQLVAGEVIEENMAAEVTEEALNEAYEETYGSAGPTDEFNAAHILVETEEEAQAIIAEVEAGADFAEVAKEKSTGPSGPNGGSLGWFGPGMMVPEFETAVVALDVGAVSEPVQTQFGWHVIKLTDKRLKDAPALETVKAELETQIRQIRVQQSIEEITAAADVDRAAAEGIDPAILTNLGLLE